MVSRLDRAARPRRVTGGKNGNEKDEKSGVGVDFLAASSAPRRRRKVDSDPTFLVFLVSVFPPSEPVDEEEQPEPDDVDEVPVPRDRFEREVPLRREVAAEHAQPDHDEHDGAERHVQPVEPSQ
jgi:hypothetical protein